MTEKKVAVHLYGPLADKYGALHHFVIRTPREAVTALAANFRGFRRDFIQHELYDIHADGDWLQGDNAATTPVSREVHLVPRIEGQAFLAAAAIGALFPSLAGVTFLGISATALIGGVLMTGLMIGLSFLLQPKIKKPDEEKGQSYAFTGPENVTQQGVAVPLVYGRVHCGSVVASVGLEANTIAWGDDLSSRQLARLIDVISEGQIGGVVDGLKGVFLDGVAVQAPNNALNFDNVDFQYRTGTASQSIIPGFAAQRTEQSVGVELKYLDNVTRTILNADVDRVSVTLSVQALTESDDEGNVYGAHVDFRIGVRDDAGVFSEIGEWTIAGKTTSHYQHSYAFNLPTDRPKPWSVIVTRTKPDNTDPKLVDNLYWETYTEIISDRVNYAHTAVVGMEFDAEQFQTIPKRTYLVDGIRCLIPDNYDPVDGTYSGVWSGAFAASRATTSNPAWIFYDIVISNRYGLGRFVPAALIDKWAIYAIGQWCDGRVPDGSGGQQRRFTCNIQIMNQQEAFDLLAEIASIFRGFSYWAGGMLVPVTDKPEDADNQFTDADVIDGVFNYSGGDVRARHTMAAVAWSDPELLGQGRISVVEDQDAISRFGVQQIDLVASGCTSEGQALRAGKWAMFTELYEAETINFSTGLKGAWVAPGSIFRVMDSNIAGKRFGGRITGIGIDDQHIVCDVRPPMVADHLYTLFCVVSEGAVQKRDAFLSTHAHTIFVTEPYAVPPPADSIFILADPGELEPTLWRATSVRQSDTGTYEIAGVRHYPDKWAYIERNLALTIPDISDIHLRPFAVTNLKVIESLVQMSPISVGVVATLSWTSTAPSFEVSWRRVNGNWQYRRTDQRAIDLPVSEGRWQFRVVPISTLGIKGPAAMITKDIIGRFAPPAEPKQFRVKISDGVALFEWLPATELDVIIGGHFTLRHSSRTQGATWAAAQVVVPSIPGTATTVEAVYRVGTWFLRTFDSVGTPSNKVATIISLQPDGRYNQFARICENPDFLGDRFYTEVLAPQQWLVLGQTGGIWDDQMADMDSWPDVDLLVEGAPETPQGAPRHGWYHFDQRIDAGGVFTVRLSADILAFPYQEGSDFIDDRLNNCDEWNDWDDVTADLGGQVQLYIRTTNDDPASPNAAWGSWQVFSPIEYTARGFEFRADLFAPAGQNIGIEELCVIADLRMKMDSAEDVAYPAAITHVTFKVKFYMVPAVVVTVQNALATDTIQVTGKTRDGFNMNITNAGAQVTRTFDWQARGF